MQGDRALADKIAAQEYERDIRQLLRDADDFDIVRHNHMAVRSRLLVEGIIHPHKMPRIRAVLDETQLFYQKEVWALRNSDTDE